MDSAATRPSVAGTADVAEPTASPEPGGWRWWWRLVAQFWPALATAAAMAVAGGVLGVFVLLRREAMVTLALPQVVAMGAAVGMANGWPTLPPALAAVAFAVAYLSITRRSAIADWALPALYVGALSVSDLAIANHGQNVADLQNLFTGIDVAVSPARAALAVPVLLAAGLGCGMLWRRWLLLAQAPAAAELSGLHPTRWDAAFLSLLALVLLLGTDSLGVVMVLGLVFLPAGAVLPWSRRIPVALAGSTALGLILLGVGFYASNVMSWPLSQSVGSAGILVLVVSHVLAFVRG